MDGSNPGPALRSASLVTPLASRAALATLVTSNHAQLLDPRLAEAIDKVDLPTAGTPRSSIHMPTLLSPNGPNDQTLFTNPDDATQHYWLGGFSLGLTGVAAQRLKWVELRPDPTGYTLEAHLTPQTTPPANATVMPSNVPITTTCILQATVNGMVREWTFQTVEVNGTDWKITLHIDGSSPDVIAQRDALYRAMTSSPDATLIVRRSLSLAIQRPFILHVPLPPVHLAVAEVDPPPPQLGVAALVGNLHGPIGPIIARPIGDGPDPLPHPFPFPHPFPHPTPTPTPTPTPVVPKPPTPIPTPVPLPHPIPFPHPLPVPQPLFSVSTISIDSRVPFQFDKTLDQNVFAKLTADVGTTASGWNHLTSLWQPDPSDPGVVHHYFQDRSDPRVIYFLPDRFCVQRRPESPHKPWLSLTTLSDVTKAALNYVVTPDWEPARVTTATTDLVAQGVPANHYPLQLFRAATASLSLKLPRVDAQGGPGFADQPGASIDTATAIHGSVTIVTDDSAALMDAIATDSTDLFSGLITVKVDDVLAKIPFVARAATFTGDVCDFTLAPDANAGTVTVTATNAIESRVVINALPIAFTRGGESVTGTLTSPSPSFPVTLAPGETLAQTFQVPGSLKGLALNADTSQIDVQPDREALINVIVDPNVPGTATRDVKLNVLAAAFAPPATGPALAAVQVAFEGNPSTVSFTAPTSDPKPAFVTGVAHLHVPLRDFLMGTTSAYTYHIRCIFADGTQTVGDAITDTLDEVYLQLPPVGG